MSFSSPSAKFALYELRLFTHYNVLDNSNNLYYTRFEFVLKFVASKKKKLRELVWNRERASITDNEGISIVLPPHLLHVILTLIIYVLSHTLIITINDTSFPSPLPPSNLIICVLSQ